MKASTSSFEEHQHNLSTFSLPEIARSTLFDYEVRGKPQRYRSFYDFLKVSSRLFEQPWQITREIEEYIEQLSSIDPTADDPAYASHVEGLRYGLTDAFYSANKLLMDMLCRAYREFLKTG